MLVATAASLDDSIHDRPRDEQRRKQGAHSLILASSRTLVEVDLKRPGRIDTKIPILPTSTPEESLGLIRILLKRNGLELPRESAIQLATWHQR